MTTYSVNFINKGKNLDVTISIASNKFLLEGAEQANIELPYSCRAGSCSTCLGKLVNGSVDQSDQSFLDEDQIASGFILTCVSYPTSDVTILTHEEENLY